jgi:hypothetical protein
MIRCRTEPGSRTPGRRTSAAFNQRRMPDLARHLGNRRWGGLLQARLAVGSSRDPLEREADRMADRVLASPTALPASAEPAAAGAYPGPALHRKYSAGEDDEVVRAREKQHGGPRPAAAAAPPIVREALSSPGRPLDSSHRAFFEGRFGHDFGDVRVHVGPLAAESARAVRAHAYTVGRSLVFDEGMYAPGTPGGRRLLAHELAHVVQQRAAAGPWMQRAEIDDDPALCQGLDDVTSRLDAHVNSVLASARSIPDGTDRVARVYDRLGQGSPYSAIEQWADDLPRNFQNRVPISGTRFRSTFSPLLLLGDSPVASRGGSGPLNSWAAKGDRTLGTLLNIGGLCIGSDKLGHFFQQGRDYFHISRTLGLGERYAVGFGEWLEGIMPSDPDVRRWIEEMDSRRWPGFDRLALNISFWQGVFGLSTTGVYSRADLAANRAGMQFYVQVHASPDVRFSAAAWVTGQWNERANPSCFGPSMARLLALNDPEFRRAHWAEVQAAYRRYLEQANNSRQGISASGQAELRRTVGRLIAPYVPRYVC